MNRRAIKQPSHQAVALWTVGALGHLLVTEGESPVELACQTGKLLAAKMSNRGCRTVEPLEQPMSHRPSLPWRAVQPSTDRQSVESRQADDLPTILIKYINAALVLCTA